MAAASLSASSCPPPAPHSAAQPSWPAWIALALIVALGMALRLDQFFEQVLLDDEWHAFHQLLRHSPAEMFLSFGNADYSIPLGLLYYELAQHVGLSEWMMRAPMMAAGALLLVLLPWYAARRLGWPTALLFALFLAISPLLLTYSRMARPYALTVLLVWLAHAAFLECWSSPRRKAVLGYGAAYVLCAALAVWLHLITLPFVAAPLLWGFWQFCRCRDRAARTVLLRRGIGLASGFVLVAGALIGPPLLADPAALAGKSGMHLPTLDTLEGAFFLWFGCNRAWAVVPCAVLALLGVAGCWRLPIVRTGLLGIGLTAAAIGILRPAWVFNAVTFVRYLLPLLPLMLLFLAMGCVRTAQWCCRRWQARRQGNRGFKPGERRWLFAVAALPLAAMALTSPLHDILRRPNSNSLALLFFFDYRIDKNILAPWMYRLPPSSFWRQQAALPSASERIAVAPFSFETNNWNGMLWERLSGQRVIPAFLNSFCASGRAGESPSPEDRRFRFRNAVFLTDVQALRNHRVDWIAWQKLASRPQIGWDSTDMAACEVKWRERFGAPDFEDPFLMAYRVDRLR